MFEMFAKALNSTSALVLVRHRSFTKLSGMPKGKESIAAKPSHVPAWKARVGESSGVKLPAKAEWA